MITSFKDASRQCCHSLSFLVPQNRFVAATQKPSFQLIMDKERTLKAMPFCMECTIKSYLSMKCPTQVTGSMGLAWAKDRTGLFRTFQISMLRWISFFLGSTCKHFFHYKRASWGNQMKGQKLVTLRKVWCCKNNSRETQGLDNRGKTNSWDT